MTRSAPRGRDPMRRRRAESARSRQAGIKKRGKSRTYPLPGKLLARPVCPSNAAASRRRSQKKNARLRKKSGVRAVTFYSGLACSSIVVIVVVMPAVVAFLARIPAFKVRSIVRAAAARIHGNLFILVSLFVVVAVEPADRIAEPSLLAG